MSIGSDFLFLSRFSKRLLKIASKLQDALLEP